MADSKSPKPKVKLTPKQQAALREENATTSEGKLTGKELEERIAPFRF